MRYLLFLLSALAIYSQLQAQNTEDWQKKYWHYRARMLGDSLQAGFIELGTAQGQSLPALGSNPDADCNKDWHIVHKFCNKRQGKGKMIWSDGTIFLGFYMAVLAFEFENLKYSGADERTLKPLKQEIWWALEAFERLDSMAEVALGFEGKLDGFFLRDDVSGDFYYKEKATNQSRFGQDSSCYDCIQSDYGCGEPSSLTGDFISQDQVLGLFIGFLAIQTFLGNEKLDPNFPTFGEKVAINVHRILEYLISVAWRLRTPTDEKIPENWGGFAIGMSLPIAQAANRMTEKYLSDSAVFRENYIARGAGFQGRIASGLLNASFGLQHAINEFLAISGALISNNWSAKKMYRRAQNSDRIIYALLHAAINKQPLPKKFDWTEIEQLLKTAPWDGPCFNTTDCQAPDGWKSYDRWIYANFKNGNPYGNKGKYTGLDYMLLYNVYHYLNKEKLPSFKSSIKR
jgi:hypothetical protein